MNKDRANALRDRILAEGSFKSSYIFPAKFQKYGVMAKREDQTCEVFIDEREYEAHVNREAGLVR